jgi:hypothetical protein
MNEINSKENSDISLFTHPVLTIKTLSIILFEQFKTFILYMLKHKILLLVSLLYIIFSFTLNNHTNIFIKSNEILYFIIYWVGLGIASSIGLGTGLHTFVLYLGPHIAKATLAASECQYFPEMLPSKWNFKDFQACNTPADGDNSVSFWIILMNIQLEAILWGIGTAIGELPPYFMAKAGNII